MKPFIPPRPLAQHIAQQWGVFTRTQAVEAGLHGKDLDRWRRAGHLVALRRGVYVQRDQYVAPEDDQPGHHLLAATARHLVTAGDTVVSHESAACLLRYRLLDPPPARPRLTVVRPEGSSPLRVHDLYTAAMPTVDRLPLSRVVTITSPARTVADCCRTLPRDAALVIADSALATTASREQVLAVLERCAGWPGAARAREVALFADGRSESVLETLARQWFLEHGLPAPELQVRLAVAATGVFLGRVDFMWPELRTVCEMDGRVKYEQPDAAVAERRNPEKRRNPLFEEKKREDAIRDNGAEVVRGYWSDGTDRGARLVGRLRAAFERGTSRTDPPGYRIVSVPEARSA